MQVKFIVTVNINEERLKRKNSANQRAGRMPTTGAAEVEERVADALRHNFITQDFQISPFTSIVIPANRLVVVSSDPLQFHYVPEDQELP